jgi:TatD DNase family protein
MVGSTCDARERGGRDTERNGPPHTMLIDTHAHLNDRKFADDLEDVLERAREAGISDIVVVGYDRENSEDAVRLAHEHSCLHATVGIHPLDAGTASEDDFARIVELAGDERVVAIGETGLDLYRGAETYRAQVELLRRHHELAAETGKPLIVHNRSATRSCVDLLEEWGAGDVCAVLHCFDGHAGLARRAAELGCFIGLDGPVTFPQKKSETREPVIWGVARAVPLDRLLVETDCPWLSPEPRRGRRNEPAYVAYIAARIAELRGIDVEQVAEATTANARRVFGIPA